MQVPLVEDAMRLAGLMTAALLIRGAVAAAQQTQPTDTTPSRDEIHVRGCVIRGADSNAFVLTKAVTVGVAKTADNMPARTPTNTADNTVRTYRLSGTNVATFVDHLVEITGTLEPK